MAKASKKVSELLGDIKDYTDLTANVKSMRNDIADLKAMMESLAREVQDIRKDMELIEERTGNNAKELVRDRIDDFSKEVYQSMGEVRGKVDGFMSATKHLPLPSNTD